MALEERKEIEKKFLLKSIPNNLTFSSVNEIKQGYFTVKEGELRIRKKNSQHFLTRKSEGDLARDEIQENISESLYNLLWPLTANRRIEKTRYEYLDDDGLLWEIDEYHGNLKGIVTAEIEFKNAKDAMNYKIPNEIKNQIMRDVTFDKSFKNRNLALNYNNKGISDNIRREYQVKFNQEYGLKELLRKGAEPLGLVSQKDTYLAGNKTWRIRETGELITLAIKGPVIEDSPRVREVKEEIIDKKQVTDLIEKRKVRLQLNKTRNIFKWQNSLIMLDQIESLGKYMEIQSPDKGQLEATIFRFGLNIKEAIKDSYLDLMLSFTHSKLLLWVMKVHDRIGEILFGLFSGILTQMGILFGVFSATKSKGAVVASIISVGIADSMADGYSIYVSKSAERGVTKSEAIRYAFGTIVGKIFCTLLFLMPLFMLKLSSAVFLALVLGLILIVLISIENSIINESNKTFEIFKNILFSLLIILVSYFVGNLIEIYIN